MTFLRTLVVGVRRTKGRFFYGMPETGASQWIYTHPEDGAPRTGEGIFPMEVIEVTQVGRSWMFLLFVVATLFLGTYVAPLATPVTGLSFVWGYFGAASLET